MNILGYKLVCTCQACPEQYDVFDVTGKQVGYLRLRHGRFRADYPNYGGETIYLAEPAGDGLFDCDERSFYLTQAVIAIDTHIAKDKNLEKALAAYKGLPELLTSLYTNKYNGLTCPQLCDILRKWEEAVSIE